MSNLDKLKKDTLLLQLVRILHRDFPDISITTDVNFYPVDDKDICITVIGVDEENAITAIQKEIPEYNMEDAATDKFSTFIYFYDVEPEPDNLVEIFKEEL